MTTLQARKPIPYQNLLPNGRPLHYTTLVTPKSDERFPLDVLPFDAFFQPGIFEVDAFDHI